MKMVHWGTGLLFTLCLVNVLGFDKSRFPGPYCETRKLEKCCPGRDDQCTVPIKDTLCYCDQFCDEHSVEDCCPDFRDTCSQTGRTFPPPPPKDQPENQCIKDGQYFQVGETVKNSCNLCTCVKSTGELSVQLWQCESDPCINDQDLISRLNGNNFGWSAKSYSKFDGVKLRDGIKYYLGTNKPKAEVVRLNPLHINPDDKFEDFDSRDFWPSNYIHPAMDQGECASSWAFSTASVAADRWSIQSKGSVLDQLSVQNILSCSRFVDGCAGGRVEDAWFYLQSQGVVDQSCYPYTSGSTKVRGKCLSSEEVLCPERSKPLIHKTTPPYRIAPDEKQIMKEIRTNGPVQAILTVKPDFYLYQRGIYRHSKAEHKDHSFTGTHSVKIIGWGEENGVKFWRAVNSWGTGWGEDGMFRIIRGENECGIEEFVVGVWARVERHEVNEKPSNRRL